MTKQEGEEMAVYGKPGKRGACFPPFPQTLEIERADFHIPSAPERDDEYNSSFKTRKDKNPASPTLRFLQAHPSIEKTIPEGSGYGVGMLQRVRIKIRQH